MDRAALELAVREIAAHPAVRVASELVFNDGRARLEFDLDLGFADRWAAEGQSPTGVKPIERVRYDFFRDFPSRAPLPSLRPDFSREHAHFQPGLTIDDRPVPCLVYGSLNEFMAARGLIGLVEQTRTWLQNAAHGRLHEGETWEPMRRDEVRDGLTCDADWVRGLIRPGAGYAFVTTVFQRRLRDNTGLTDIYRGRLGGKVAIAGRAQALLCNAPKDSLERGLALVLWADAEVNGRPVVEDTFRPDHVLDMKTFADQAARFRLSAPLQRARLALSNAAVDQVSGIAAMPVIMLVRRPRRLPDSDCAIELIAYLLQLTLPSGDPAWDEVRPVACYEDIRPRLLRRLSGDRPGQPWALLGAGSLGSKIALHLARSGAAPTICADIGWLRPHNGARHALYPSLEDGSLSGWLEPKAPSLAAAIGGLGQQTASLEGNHSRLINVLNQPNGPEARWLLNTTGSTVAREWLASREAVDAPPVVEAGLFDGGELGFVTIEGDGHNPDSAELMAAIYQLARHREDLRTRLFRARGHEEFVPIGQGCDSATMVMSDAHLSAMAAPIAEIAAAIEGTVREGQTHILSRDGLALRHERLAIDPRTRVPLEGLEDWNVSLPPEVLQAIEDDVARWPSVETGGVLVGWSSLISRHLYVVDVIPAPPDSLRTSSEFVLGVQGLQTVLAELAAETTGALHCVGTWHSHLGKASPSAKDWASAAAIGNTESKTMTLLVHGSDGLRAISTTAAAAMTQRRPRRVTPAQKATGI